MISTLLNLPGGKIFYIKVIIANKTLLVNRSGCFNSILKTKQKTLCTYNKTGVYFLCIATNFIHISFKVARLRAKNAEIRL